MDIYEQLRQRLATNPVGAPPSEAFDDILRILFTPDEATLALSLTFLPQPVDRIADKTGLSMETVRGTCETMADKGVIFSREKKGDMGYCLLPAIPGLFEFPFMGGGGTPMHERLGTLWETYHMESQGMEFASSPTPLMRVLPVEESVTGHGEVLPYEVITRMMEKNHTFALAECACRVSRGEEACDKPTDVCLLFDGMARFLIDRKHAREITREEAHATLLRAEEAGLVHTTNNSQDRLNLICNCCGCCCTILTCRTKLDAPHPFSTSQWFARVDETECTGCGICADERCMLDAIDTTGDTASIDEEKCIGCGLCVSSCPAEAIAMEKRATPPPLPETGSQLGSQVLMEKGRLEAFIEMNT